MKSVAVVEACYSSRGEAVSKSSCSSTTGECLKEVTSGMWRVTCDLASSLPHEDLLKDWQITSNDHFRAGLMICWSLGHSWEVGEPNQMVIDDVRMDLMIAVLKWIGKGLQQVVFLHKQSTLFAVLSWRWRLYCSPTSGPQPSLHSFLCLAEGGCCFTRTPAVWLPSCRQIHCPCVL